MEPSKQFKKASKTGKAKLMANIAFTINCFSECAEYGWALKQLFWVGSDIIEYINEKLDEQIKYNSN